jgi:hypothetical protein
MQQTIRAAFTTRPLNPVSLAIRCANPVNLVTIAPASHVIVLDGARGHALEASMLHGVRSIPVEEALSGCKIMEWRDYRVPDAEAGLAWMRDAAARKVPYDWGGALGLGLAPGESWQDEDKLFCFEFLALGLEKAGRPIFRDDARVTAHMLLSIIP